MKYILVFGFLVLCGMSPIAHAAPQVEIVMEKTTYSYCEKLFYVIRVSEVTGDPAIIHIRDSMGKSSSAVPVGISGHENPVPSLVAFSKDVFPLGDYFVDVEYAGQFTTAGFTLVDSGKKCLPDLLRTIAASWIAGNVSDGILVDAFEKYVDRDILSVPFPVTAQNINEVQIPSWVKGIALWWIDEKISDDAFAGAVEYLLHEGIILIGGPRS